jgi:hypothetical protein
MTLAMIVFFASLVLIVALFTLRFVEERRGAKFGEFPRKLADNAALNLKDALVSGREHIEKLPPELAHHTMRAAHSGALGAASLARSLEAHAHRFADFVSSKGSFQRRETKSEFLKQVTDFKNGSGDAEEENS